MIDEHASHPLSVRGAGIALAAVSISLIFGAAVSLGGPALVGVVIAAVGGVLVGRFSPGVLLGLVVLACANGIPGFDLNPAGLTISRVADFSAVGIVGLLVVSRLMSSAPIPQYPARRAIRVICVALVTWWAITYARTVLLDGVTVTRAALYCRDFLYFPLLLPLLCDYMASNRRQLRPLVTTLCLGAALYAAAEVARATGTTSAEAILHAHAYREQGGLVRVYSPMNALVRVGFPLACAGVVFARTAGQRLVAIAAAALFGTSIVLQLTRAAYAGAVVGLLVASLIWWLRRDDAARHARGRFLRAAGLVGGAAVVAGMAVPHSLALLSTGSARAWSIVTDYNNNSGTVGYRIDLVRSMTDLLGSKWPIGLGFLHPASRFFAALPDGGIRNPDVGLFNGLMTFGAIGTILISAAIVTVIRSVSGLSANDLEWIRFGVAAWAAGALVSSLTLVDLYSAWGLGTAAVVAAVGVAATIPDLGDDDRKVPGSGRSAAPS